MASCPPSTPTPSWPPNSTACPRRVAELLDRAEVTLALEVIWQRVRRCNRYVEERAPWQLAKDPRPPPQLDQALASLAEGLRVISVLLHPYMPASDRPAARGAGRPRLDRRRRVRGAGRRRAGRPLEPLFPKRA